MSVIQKIRTKYAKLAGFVIAAALVAFILMDALSSRSVSSLFGNDGSLAKVDGEKVDQQTYLNRIEEYNVLYSYSNGGQQLDDQTQIQIRQQALNDLVNEIIVKNECEEVGITTTEKEADDLIYGPNPHQAVQNFQYFKDQQTGMFNPALVKNFESQIQDAMNQPNADPQVRTIYNQWQVLKSFVLRTNTINKYNSLVTNSIYVPSFLIEKQGNEQKQVASLDLVTVSLNTADDADVNVTEAEMINYMKEHKALYTVDEPSRSIEYVSFDVAPKGRDTARALNPLNTIKDDFAAVDTSKVEAFVNRNSDKGYAATYTMKKSFMSAFSDSIFSLPTGSVYGPYFEDGYYKLTKVVDRQSFPDSVKCRHILVTTFDRGNQTLSDSAAKKRIDSVVAAIKGGANFDTMVQKYSDDQGSKETGGVYTFEFSQRQGISKEFQEFIFEEGKDGQSKVVKVANQAYAGYHYIEIIKQSGFETAIKTATVSKQLYPNDETETEIYNAASEFAVNNNTAAKFDEAVKTDFQSRKRVAQDIKKNDFMLPGLGASRDLIQWAYGAKVGDVSTVIQLKGKYVVAKVSGVQNKGLAKITPDNRNSVEGLVRREKMLKKVTDKYNSMTSLDQIASAAGAQIRSADSFTAASAFIGELGYEPKVAGYAFYDGFKKGSISPGILGQGGVFYLSLKDRSTKDTPIDSAMLNQQKMMMQGQLQNQLNPRITELLKKKASVEYNVENF